MVNKVTFGKRRSSTSVSSFKIGIIKASRRQRPASDPQIKGLDLSKSGTNKKSVLVNSKTIMIPVKLDGQHVGQIVGASNVLVKNPSGSKSALKEPNKFPKSGDKNWRAVIETKEGKNIPTLGGRGGRRDTLPEIKRVVRRRLG